MDTFMRAAIAEAEQGWREGGIPIGSVLVHNGMILGRGHNQRVQHDSVIHHGEMNALENAGRQKVKDDVDQRGSLPHPSRDCAGAAAPSLSEGMPASLPLFPLLGDSA
jgi:creatinine deaminase